MLGVVESIPRFSEHRARDNVQTELFLSCDCCLFCYTQAAQRDAIDSARERGTSKGSEMRKVTAQMKAMHVDDRVMNYAQDSLWLAYYANATAQVSKLMIKLQAE